MGSPPRPTTDRPARPRTRTRKPPPDPYTLDGTPKPRPMPPARPPAPLDPKRCPRCRRRLIGPRSVRRGIGVRCWRAIREARDRDRERPALPFDPATRTVILWRGPDGEAYANVAMMIDPRTATWPDWRRFPDLVAPSNVLRALARAILVNWGTRAEAERLADLFAADFLAALPTGGGTIGGADIQVWLWENERYQ
jgi:hypothetical protein